MFDDDIKSLANRILTMLDNGDLSHLDDEFKSIFRDIAEKGLRIAESAVQCKE